MGPSSEAVARWDPVMRQWPVRTQLHASYKAVWDPNIPVWDHNIPALDPNIPVLDPNIPGLASSDGPRLVIRGLMAKVSTTRSGEVYLQPGSTLSYLIVPFYLF